MSAIRLVLGCRSNQWEDCRLGPRSVCTAAELRAVDLSSSHQFEEEIGTSSSENGLFIPKMEFSVRTAHQTIRVCGWGMDGAIMSKPVSSQAWLYLKDCVTKKP